MVAMQCDKHIKQLWVDLCEHVSKRVASKVHRSVLICLGVIVCLPTHSWALGCLKDNDRVCRTQGKEHTHKGDPIWESNVRGYRYHGGVKDDAHYARLSIETAASCVTVTSGVDKKGRYRMELRLTNCGKGGSSRELLIAESDTLLVLLDGMFREDHLALLYLKDDTLWLSRVRWDDATLAVEPEHVDMLASTDLDEASHLSALADRAEWVEHPVADMLIDKLIAEHPEAPAAIFKMHARELRALNEKVAALLERVIADETFDPPESEEPFIVARVIAELSREEGHAATAVEFARRAAERYPQSAEIKRALAAALEREQKPCEALEVIESLFVLPTDADPEILPGSVGSLNRLRAVCKHGVEGWATSEGKLVAVGKHVGRGTIVNLSRFEDELLRLAHTSFEDTTTGLLRHVVSLVDGAGHPVHEPVLLAEGPSGASLYFAFVTRKEIVFGYQGELRALRFGETGEQTGPAKLYLAGGDTRARALMEVAKGSHRIAGGGKPDPAMSVSLLEEAIEIAPEDPELQGEFGLALGRAGERCKASKQLEKALEMGWDRKRREWVEEMIARYKEDCTVEL